MVVGNKEEFHLFEVFEDALPPHILEKEILQRFALLTARPDVLDKIFV